MTLAHRRDLRSGRKTIFYWDLPKRMPRKEENKKSSEVFLSKTLNKTPEKKKKTSPKRTAKTNGAKQEDRRTFFRSALGVSDSDASPKAERQLKTLGAMDPAAGGCESSGTFLGGLTRLL